MKEREKVSLSSKEYEALNTAGVKDFLTNHKKAATLKQLQFLINDVKSKVALSATGDLEAKMVSVPIAQP